MKNHDEYSPLDNIVISSKLDEIFDILEQIFFSKAGILLICNFIQKMEP